MMSASEPGTEYTALSLEQVKVSQLLVSTAGAATAPATVRIDTLHVHDSAVGVHIGDRHSTVTNNFFIASGRRGQGDTGDLNARIVDFSRQVSTDAGVDSQHTHSYLDTINLAVDNAIKAVIQRVQVQTKWWYLVNALIAISSIACVVLAAVLYTEDWRSGGQSSTSGRSGNNGDSAGSQGWLFLILAFVAISIISLVSTVLFSIIKFTTIRYEAVNQGEIVPGENLSDGPKIMRRAVWLAQTPMGEMESLDMPVERVIIIHTATEEASTTAQCIEHIRHIQMYHIEAKKFNDIGYNFLVGGDGCVYEGRSWNKVGAHTKGYNQGSLGIALIGTFINKLPNEFQLKALKQLIDVGVRIKKISQNHKIVAHFQLTPTESPGIALARHLASNWPRFDTSLPFDKCSSLGRELEPYGFTE